MVSSILGGGGGKSSSSSTSTSGGFDALPEEIKNAFINLAKESQKYIGQTGTSAFTPIGETDAEKRALADIMKGFTPTQESLNADIAMQMNPFDKYVIDEINNQAGGEYSLLKQALNQSGQLGSNRQMLSANDIDMRRLGQIGQFKQGQFNTAMQNALTALPALRFGDTQARMGGGAFQRDLGLQTSTAPIQNLQALSGILNILPRTEGTQTNTQSSSSRTGGSGFGSLLSAAGQAYTAFSDRTLKEKIKHVGRKNGFNLYEFSYKGDSKRFIGVMADEVERVLPEAVTIISGFKAVNYGMIGIPFMEA